MDYHPWINLTGLDKLAVWIASEEGQREIIMSDESYPLLNVSHLARRVQNSEVSEIRRDWTGNDESARNHHGRVDLRESPLKLRLSWKRSSKDPVHLIGVYELDLRELLTAGYARIERNTQNEIRLRFYHGYDDVIYIQVNSKEPGLPVGRMS